MYVSPCGSFVLNKSGKSRIKCLSLGDISKPGSVLLVLNKPPCWFYNEPDCVTRFQIFRVVKSFITKKSC